ncbi:MAG: transglycosylase domain-containing protein [Deltaproteobacteria bacterium]|nr:transglycosylase domain-containing protein [Deltaproteobacteria bacterium]
MRLVPSKKLRRVLLMSIGAMIILPVAVLGLAVVTVAYPVARLQGRGHGAVVVKDRTGVVLRRMNVNGTDGFTPRHAWVQLKDIDAHVISTLLASEDKNFFEHCGVDVPAILRAVALNLKEGGFHFGASTITMQLVRNLHSPGAKRTLWNKLRETVLALRLERAVSKPFILEQYLNRAYFGNQAYGIEAAARRYFGKSASALSVGEATYLAVLPRGPSFYNPVKHHDRVIKRQAHLLNLLVADGRISRNEAARAKKEKVRPTLHGFAFKAPHFVDWVLDELPKETQQSGGEVVTTLDWYLQEAVEHSVAAHVAALKDRGVEQAGVVVLDAPTGEVLAMVGSASFHEKGGSTVNIATRRRYPGSALKPFVYATAIEQGDSPATIVADRITPDSAYQVRGKKPTEHGMVRYREALAGSYNIAAIHVLEKTGVTRVMEKLRLSGVSELSQSAPEYGLRLALGDTKVRLVDLAAGYGFLVREGRVISPVGIHQIDFAGGQKPWQPRQTEQQVFSKQVAWLTMDMLSDTEARRKVFGDELPADLPYKVAVKTGTARGFSDTVAIFATKELIVAAWTGRFDGNPTKGVLGMSGAAPLARDALLLASRGKALTLPKPPRGIERATVCPESGKRITPNCPHQKLEYFQKGTVPNEQCDVHVHP